MSRQALIIDKDTAFSDRLAQALGACGYGVEMRTTGREGMDSAKAAPPDLIILCVELDDTSGYSICAKMKKDPELRDIPLVITSEKATKGTFDHHKKLKTRAQHYLMKPFEPNELLQELGLATTSAPHPGSPPPLPGDRVLASVERGLDPEVDAINAISPATLGDEEAFGDAGAELDQAIASLSDEPPPLPDELTMDSVAGLPEDFDEDEIRTTIGAVPSAVLDAVEANGAAGPVEAAPTELLRRLKAAERARDEAVAQERAAQAQLQALSEGASQLPASNAANRDVLAVKKELNAKERELLELKDTLQQRDVQLLDARDREAELEEKVVQTEEQRSSADRARVEAEGRIAGAEARAVELERSSKAALDERDGEIDRLGTRIAQLEEDLEAARSLDEERRKVIAEHEESLEELSRELETRLGEIEGLRADLESTRSTLEETSKELAASNESNEGLTARGDALERDLDESRGESEALRGALADTEDRLTRATRRIREDEDIRGKAKQALEITLNLLAEAGYDDSFEDSLAGRDREHTEGNEEAVT